MIAKSKASEVGPAAGTYVKLQEAYASENNDTGTWQAIGYKGPGAQNNDGTSTTASFGYSGAKGTWVATSSVALNDCAANSTWSLSTTYTPSSGNLVTTATSSDKPNCVQALTPNFCKIATSAECN